MNFTKEENVKTHYDSKVTQNAIEAMDYVIGGKPLTYEEYCNLILKPTIEKLELEPNHQVLDVGCGAGVILEEVEKLVKYAEGFDISERLVKMFKGKSKVSSTSVLDANYPKCSFDRIYMISVGIHFENFEYFKKVVRKLFSILKKDGILLIGDQLIKDFYSTDKYLCVEMKELIDFLSEFKNPYSICAQKKEKRQLVGGRADIILYKDKN